MADQFIKVLYLDQTQSIETWICESNNAKYQSVIYSHPVFKNSSRFDIETFNKYWGGNNSVARVEGNTIKVMLRLHQPWLSLRMYVYLALAGWQTVFPHGPFDSGLV